MKLFQRIFGPSENGNRKPPEHKSGFVYRWQRLPDSIAGEYTTSTIFEIANRHSVTPVHVSKKLRSLGVKIRPQSKLPPDRPDLRIKLSPEKITWALEQDDKDIPHAHIAKELGVSSERIRQICLAANKPSRRSRMTKSIEVKEAIEARRQDRQQRLLAISEAWKSGATFTELNNAFFHLKHHFNVANKISDLRHYHPDLFPYRTKVHSGKPQSMGEIKGLSKMWIAGKTTQEIAAAFGYKTRESLGQAIMRLRNKFPKMFPPRFRHGVMTLEQTEERRKKFSELWKANKPASEIMEAMGYTNIKSVYQAASNYRRCFGSEMFPLRSQSPTNKMLPVPEVEK